VDSLQTKTDLLLCFPSPRRGVEEPLENPTSNIRSVRYNALKRNQQNYGKGMDQKEQADQEAEKKTKP